MQKENRGSKEHKRLSVRYCTESASKCLEEECKWLVLMEKEVTLEEMDFIQLPEGVEWISTLGSVSSTHHVSIL